MKKKKAFTLSEALITLTVLGIIAVLTVPLIKGNIEEKITVERLKTVYESLSIAFEMAVIENGPVEKWGLKKASSTDSTTGEHDVENVFWNKITPYLKSVKYDSAEGFALSDEKWEILSLKDKSVNGPFYPQLALTNGICYTPFWTVDPNCNDHDTYGKEYCGSIGIDLNCRKGPNIEGRDIFHFYVRSNKIAPMGDEDDKGHDFLTMCRGLTGKLPGRGCAAWVIYNENMDYLRCPNKLSWAGNHSCP